jgi:hypothetical protein
MVSVGPTLASLGSERPQGVSDRGVRDAGLQHGDAVG